MQIEQKVNIHNRFDIHIDNIETGEHREIKAYNIVLDQMWTRLCGGSTYFVNIHFGTGAGTPLASNNRLFTHLGTKVAVDDEIVKAIPVSRWKRKITLNPEEFVGQTITEVGIAFGATNTNLVTHAMLKDSEGNPISITKTDTDVITIFATVFITFPEGILIDMPSNNALVNYLFGGVFPVGSFGLLDLKSAFLRLGSTAIVTWTADIPNKKRKTNTPRFDINTGNGHVKILDFTNIFAVEFPSPGIFTGQPYVGVPVGTGDGVKTKFTLPSANINQASLALKLAGATISTYTKKILYSNFTRQSHPASLPTNNSLASAITPDGLVMAVAQSSSPFIITYDWVGGAWVKRPNPTDLATDAVNGVALSVDGLVMALSNYTSPFITTYDWVGGAWVKRPNPASLPVNGGGVALSADGLILAITQSIAPFVYVYDWVGGAWVKRPNPTDLATGNGGGVALTPDGLVMAVAHYTAPFITTYDWVGGAWVKRPNPTSLSGGNANGVAITPDGLVMAVAHYTSPFTTTYDWVGGAWVKRPNPASLPPDTANGVALSADGLVLVVSHQTSPFITTYDWVGGAWVKRPNPASLPGGHATKIAITPDGRILVVSHNNSPFVTIYTALPFTEVTLDAPATTGVPITADYTVDGLHKTYQYVVDVSFAIQFGEGA